MKHKAKPILTPRLLLGVFVLPCALLVVGCSDDANPVEQEFDSPIASETAGITFAAKKPCENDPSHPSCKEDDGNGGDDATFTVEVFVKVGGLYASAGIEKSVVAKGNETRPTLGETTMTLKVNLVDTNTGELARCSTGFGSEVGLFAISTARIPKSSPTFTYVEANFFLFEVDGVDYALTFGPDDDGAIDDNSKWPPPNTGDMNIVTGRKLKLRVPSGPQKKGPCNGIITQDWKIEVTKNK